MKKFVVGYVNFFNSDLILEIVTAGSIRSAIFAHSKINSYDWVNCPEDLEAIKQYFFDADCLVSAIEI